MSTRSVETVVFLSLVLDLFAFTIPLPLFPRLIEWYTKRESSNPHGFLSQTLSVVSSLRGFFYNPSENSQKWDIVLLGGLMGSIFSTLQFLVSPYIGGLSDRYGRKKILLLTMIGNLLSAIVWIQSTTFASFMLSRAIGGASEGNVQLAIAILSDVTTPANRARALSHVGIAFAICFCIGPPIGAYFASRPAPLTFAGRELKLNIYATPAIITLILLTIECIFLVVALPETRGMSVKIEKEKQVKGKDASSLSKRKADVPTRLALLKSLRQLHLLFLGLFSGVEFTLTFLTFDLLDWDNKQNGSLIGFIGIVSAILQGGYVRRAIPKVGEGKMARRGVTMCTIALGLLAILPNLVATRRTVAIGVLRAAAVCLAFTSATVVNSLTAFASLQCDDAGVNENTGKPNEEHPQLAKGQALGRFRSSGQLGRAIGPLLACALYWTVGPSVTYAVAGIAMSALVMRMGAISRTQSR
ncbi:MFS general substrate transporter [Ramaria rubella]|nr:MFS general substrate transporter [Ramaria rubella]